MAKKIFSDVNLNISFPEMERRLLDLWSKEGLLGKYLNKNDSSKKLFSFIDGPITANNPMGVHHAWGRTYKDLFQRYKNMQGFKQRFQNGFDSQGLWVEVEVEKELGFKNKKDIEDYGVAKFVEKCKERVKKYSDIQTEQSKRLGYFMDWDHSYFTLSEDNNYMIWHFLSVCNENDWIYKGKDSVPWCPRCETAISQHEMLTEDYKEVTHKSVVLQFPILDRKNEYLLVWTTTPWTIPANIAVAVDKNIEYALVEKDGNKYWLAKEAIERIFGSKLNAEKTVLGKELVGFKYKGGFDDLPKVKEVAKVPAFHSVIETDDRLMPISTEEGTGLVHTAVSAGTEDFRLGQKLGLPMIPVIEDDASYMEGLGFLSGKNAKKNPEIIFEYFGEEEKNGKKWVFSTFNYKHRYPACWRCKSELVWKVTDEWYIAMDKKGKDGNKTLRERMIAVSESINWMPKFGKKREYDWLSNMGDWLISKKNRYWGLALPIWECKKCDSFEVISGYDELKNKSVSGWDKFEGHTPHKPYIDYVKIKCQKCGGEMGRIEPVGNPWLDAGIVPFSTISKENGAANFEKTDEEPLYPKNKKEWENWFPADFITESFPGQFKNWFYSLIAMSTVLEDRAPFENVLGFATLLDENGRPMHKSSGNSIEFNQAADEIGVDVMRWLYVKQNVNENLLFGVNLANQVRRTFHLKLWNIYNFFVTYANIDGIDPRSGKNVDLSLLDKWIKARTDETLIKVTKSLDKFNAASASEKLEELVEDFSSWYIRRSRDRVGPAANDETDKQAFYKTTYDVLNTLMKMLSVFTPFISDEIYRNLNSGDSVHLAQWPKQQGLVDKKLLDEMEIARVVIEKVHSLRKEEKIPVRQPLAGLVVSGIKVDPSFEDLIMDELNIKSIKFEDAKKESYQLDTNITKELKDEADARELIRKIQNTRREMGLTLNDKTEVQNDWVPENSKLYDWILAKTSSLSLSKGSEFKVTKK